MRARIRAVSFGHIVTMLPRIPTWVQLIVLSTIIIPVLAYLVGSWLVGPYEGNFGMLGFFVSIYADAMQAKPAPWILLLAAPAIVVVWHIALHKRIRPE